MLYRRRDIKRMFAYSSIEHMGIIAFAFGMGGPLANFAGLLHMTMHSLTKSAIFFAVGHIAQVKGTQKIADMGGLTVTNPVLGWGLVLGVVAIAGLPPLGIFMSEFLVVSSTFAREPWLAIAAGVRHSGRARRAVPAAQQRSPSASRAGRPRRRKASYVPMFAHLALVFIAGIYLPPALVAWFQNVAEAAGIAPWPLLDIITHRRTGRSASAVAARDRGRRRLARMAIEHLAAGRCTLLGLWGDAARRAHGAARRRRRRHRRRQLSTARTGSYPSGRRAASAGDPARTRDPRSVRPRADRRAGYAALARSRLLGRAASARQPGTAARTRAPYAFLPAEGEGLHQIPVGPGACRHHRAGPFPLHRQWRDVVRLEQRLGYVHKGIESLMARRDARRGGEARRRAPPATARSPMRSPSRMRSKPRSQVDGAAARASICAR